MRLSRPLLLFVLLYSLLPTTISYAQDSAGVEIQPAFVEERADPDTVIEKTFRVTNLSGEEQTYYLIKRDITGVTGNNTPVFAEEGIERTGYEISAWVTFPEGSLTIPPEASAEVPITITVPQNASPGSHFGGIFVSLEPPKLREIGAAVGYDVGAIISIRISGDVVETARIRQFSTDKFIYSVPEVSFSTRVENPGNVLIRPRGPLEVTNMFGRQAGAMVVNDTAGGVFPETIREFTNDWEGDGPGFGRYSAIVTLVYGEPGAQQFIDSELSFWILPVRIILPILAGLTILFLVGYFFVRLYINRSITHISTRQGRRVVVHRRRHVGISRLTLVAVALLVTTTVFLLVLLVLFA